MNAAAAATPPACYADIRTFYQNDLRDSTLRVYVSKAHGYALAWWSTRYGGGQGIFRRSGERWCKVVSGGGALDENGLVSYGVPRDVARQLMGNAAVSR